MSREADRSQQPGALSKSMNPNLFESSLFPELEAYKHYFFPLVFILILFSFIYRQLVTFNFWLFRKKIRKSISLSLPVVSVGNLTMGGTGKTPVIIFLANLLTAKKSRVAIVSRNYRSISKLITKVDLKISKSDSSILASQVYGDEPVLIAEKTDVPVYVGPQKSLTAKEVIRNEKVEMILVDDGFQHLKLTKNCNILLLDVTQMDENNFLFPRGRYREPISGYSKANILFWTKTNFIPSSRLKQLKQQFPFTGFQVDWEFEMSAIEFPSFPNLNFDLHASGLNSDRVEFFTLRRFVLVTAIARPDFFRKMIAELNPKCELIEKKFKDHHQYTAKDIKKILDKPLNFKHFLTTEKDYTKLKEIWPKEVPLGVVKWSLKPNKTDEQIYESITSFLH